MSPNLRIYHRQRGGATRWYADFRAFADVGGRREPLVPPGDTLATSDHEEAVRLALRRLDGDSNEDVPAHLLRREAADARPGRSGVALHRQS